MKHFILIISIALLSFIAKAQQPQIAVVSPIGATTIFTDIKAAIAAANVLVVLLCSVTAQSTYSLYHVLSVLLFYLHCLQQLYQHQL